MAGFKKYDITERVFFFTDQTICHTAYEHALRGSTYEYTMHSSSLQVGHFMCQSSRVRLANALLKGLYLGK